MKDISMQKSNCSLIPNEWEILALPDGYFKVFAYMSYKGMASFKINSGIKSIKETKDFYIFYGFSGSIYKCRKDRKGIKSEYGLEVLYHILKISDGLASIADNKWKELI